MALAPLLVALALALAPRKMSLFGRLSGIVLLSYYQIQLFGQDFSLSIMENLVSFENITKPLRIHS